MTRPVDTEKIAEITDYMMDSLRNEIQVIVRDAAHKHGLPIEVAYTFAAAAMAGVLSATMTTIKKKSLNPGTYSKALIAVKAGIGDLMP